MMDSHAQMLFSEACLRSAREATLASINASTDASMRALEFWAGAGKAWLGMLAGEGATGRPRMSGSAAPGWNLAGAKSWDGMTPWSMWLAGAMYARAFGATPMASALMAAGVPSNTAWPVAKANAAAIDAADIAIRAVERAFASYRSDGGHATAQIIKLPVRRRTAASAAPMPWDMSGWLAFWTPGRG